jgi:aspartyl/asparaginyl beta-hydroxylase (cupin superfamily)
MNNFLNFFDYKEVFPELEQLKNNIEIIKTELNQYEQSWFDWPEKKLYTENTDWKIVPFFGFGNWLEEMNQFFPKTIDLLKNVKGLRTAILSKIGPQTSLQYHYGWSSLANYVLRCHLGLIVPENCGIIVDNEVSEQKQNEWLVFDDSKLHSAFNFSNQPRTVLLLDIERPPHIPLGKAELGETKELIDFLQYFKNKINNS